MSNAMLPPRVFLTLMTSAGNEDNLREIIDPLLPHIDGVITVMHRPCEGDPGLAYLEATKGVGKVIVRDWIARHDISQSETLWAGILQEGDLFIITDTLERPAASFIARCKGDLNTFMLEHDLDCLVYFGKPFIVRYNETMHYQGSPHWGLQGVRSAIELSHMYPDEGKVRLNVRPWKRADKMHWCRHYLKYAVSYPAGSNHMALGIEQYVKPGESHEAAFYRRETNRLAFRQEMKSRGFPLTVEGFIQMCSASPLDDDLKAWLRSDKVFSDGYHRLVLRDTRVKDTHRPEDALPIP